MRPNAEQPSVSGASERLYLAMNLLDEIKQELAISDLRTQFHNDQAQQNLTISYAF